MQNNEMPSMDNIYNCKYYDKVRNYEQSLSDKFYKKAQMPFKTGVIPHYLNGDDMNVANNMVQSSLSGEVMNMNDFKHGNMQPFLRKGVTQNNIENFALNKNMGYSTDVNFKKREVPKSAFFDTISNFNDNMIDRTRFLKARASVGKIQNNISPIDPIRVGPGLNKGYSSEGTGGFQQADTASYVKPKTKEELRPDSDQRSSIYTLPLKPMNNTEQRGYFAPIEKNRADRSFYQTEDNWFKGQSVLKKDRERPIEPVKDEAESKRIPTHINYYGSIKSQEEQATIENDYGKNSIIVYDTERNLTQKETPVANFSSVIKAMVAPITDAIKFSLKEYLIDNPRINGNAAPQLPEKGTLYDPDNHIMKTTIKETTIHEGNNGNLSGPDETYSALYDTARTTTKETTIHEGNGGVLSGIDETYSALYDTAKTTTKETTIHEGNNGNLSGIDETYSALYDTAKTTTKETTIHEGNGGFMEGKQSGYAKNGDKTRTTLRQTLKPEDTTRNINKTSYYSTYVYDPSIVAKKTVKETTVDLGGSKYGFLGGILNGLFGGYLVKEEKAKNTQRQFSLTENFGILGSKTEFAPTDREADYNTEIDGTRELVMMKAGYTPNGGGKFVGVPKEYVNVATNKKQIDLEEAERIGHMGLISEGMPVPLTRDNITKEPMRSDLKANAYNSRLDSGILSTLIDNDTAIKINPIRIDCDPI